VKFLKCVSNHRGHLVQRRNNRPLRLIAFKIPRKRYSRDIVYIYYLMRCGSSENLHRLPEPVLNSLRREGGLTGAHVYLQGTSSFPISSAQPVVVAPAAIHSLKRNRVSSVIARMKPGVSGKQTVLKLGRMLVSSAFEEIDCQYLNFYPVCNPDARASRAFRKDQHPQAQSTLRCPSPLLERNRR